MATEINGTVSSAEETLALAKALGESLFEPTVIALIGEMGSGKTTFVRGLAEGLEVADVVNSPTYALMQRYEGRMRLDHYDAWMEGRERAVMADGAHELLGLEGVSVIEWAEQVEDFLPDGRLQIRLSVLGVSERGVHAQWIGGSLSAQALACLHAIQVSLVPEEGAAG
jgi:tRNA threonylcarbamoyladenosine biosynthesis protein TsaE